MRLSIFDNFSSSYEKYLRTGSVRDNIEAMKTKKVHGKNRRKFWKANQVDVWKSE